MKKNLIVYSTTDGHTKSICSYIKFKLQEKNDTKLVSINELGQLNLTSFDMIIIGASIRYGKHRPELYQFINKNKKIINNKKNAFFTVNAIARKIEKNHPETNPYMIKFLELSKWQPLYLAVFAGKINYPKYNFLDKFLIRVIMWMTNGPTNTSCAHDFTNCDDIDQFCAQLMGT